MKAGQLFIKTLPFCLAKLLIGGATVIASVLLLVILLLIGSLFGDAGLGFAILIWVALSGAVRYFIMHYIGYLIKAGHVAVLAEASVTGVVPANQIAYGKDMVKSRFATANIYFVVDKLVSGAVKQIQRGIEKLGNALDFIPGMQQITQLATFFVQLSLGYVDECCLGYTFYKKEQSAFQSACDGVVIYAQNIKHLLKNAALTMLKVILLVIVALVLVFVPLGLLFKVMGWNALIAFLLACFITSVLKFAFLDSFILCQTMVSYMQVAPTTQITFDLYNKLCGLSNSFKELWNKSKTESPQPAFAAAAPAGTATVSSSQPAQNSVPTAAAQSKFCTHCGKQCDADTKFCGSCGAPMQ